MVNRITIDFKDPRYLKQLKFCAAEEGKPVREIVITALEAYFSSRLENRALAKLGEEAFAEWDNSKDAEYDDL